MKQKVCVPILASSLREALGLIRKAEKKHADLIEFRLDYIKEKIRIDDLASATRLPRIATNRIASEGGKFRGRETKRLQSLLYAAEAGCEFIDIELRTRNVADITKKIKKLGARTIISYHNFHYTQQLQELNRILKKQVSVGADISKIILTAKKTSDNLRILEFVSNATRKTKIVSFAMGELGVVSRVLSPVYGASFTFASVERGAESAKGQLTIEEIKNIYASMRLE